jgi:2'-5' RNA ligase
MARNRAGRPEARSLRLFVAFDVSPEAAAAVARAIDPWRSVFPSARWVPPENWHVTLKFMGQTWPRLERWVHDRVGEAAAACPPVPSRLTGLGSFPSKARGRVLWAGINDRDGGLARVVTTLDECLGDEFRAEPRAFSPHLTVARSDPPLRLPPAFPATDLEPVAFIVDRIDLYRSHLVRPAPRYETLASFVLAGSRPA